MTHYSDVAYNNGSAGPTPVQTNERGQIVVPQQPQESPKLNGSATHHHTNGVGRPGFFERAVVDDTAAGLSNLTIGPDAFPHSSMEAQLNQGEHWSAQMAVLEGAEQAGHVPMEGFAGRLEDFQCDELLPAVRSGGTSQTSESSQADSVHMAPSLPANINGNGPEAAAAAAASAGGGGGGGGREHETDDDLFAMYVFKVAHCSKQFVHDWKECPYAHEGETARRRHPSQHTAQPCPDFKATKACPRSDKCPMAHGPWEAGLHPDAFRTNLCAYGSACQRRMCFFAHDVSELRTPQPGLVHGVGQVAALKMQGGATLNFGGPQAASKKSGGGGGAPGRPGMGHRGGGAGGHNGGGGAHGGQARGGEEAYMQGRGRGRANHAGGYEGFAGPGGAGRAREGGWGGQGFIQGAQARGGGGGGGRPQSQQGGQAGGRGGYGYNGHGPHGGGAGAGKSGPVSRRQMQGLAGYNAARQNMQGQGGGRGRGGLQVKVPNPNGVADAGAGGGGRGGGGGAMTPEWVKQEDTSWVDKLLDSPL